MAPVARASASLFLGESLVDDPLCGGVHARIGDRIQPMAKLAVQIVEIAKGAAEKEVLADIAEGRSTLPLVWPVGPAGAGLKTVMAREVDERAVVDDEPVRLLADDRGLHAIVEDLARDAADRLEGGDVTAQDALQVLVDYEARPDQPGITEHHREQPDDALDARLVGKLHFELGEVDLRLLAGRRLEADFKAGRARAAAARATVRDRGVAALISTLLEFAKQAAPGQGRERGDPFAQIRRERIDQTRPRRPGLVVRRSRPLAMCTRTVFRSMPSWRAMADTEKP